MEQKGWYTMSIISEIFHNINENRRINKLAKFQTFVSTAISELATKASQCFKAKDLESFEKVFNELDYISRGHCMTLRNMSIECTDFGCDAAKVDEISIKYIDYLIETTNEVEEMRDIIKNR